MSCRHYSATEPPHDRPARPPVRDRSPGQRACPPGFPGPPSPEPPPQDRPDGLRSHPSDAELEFMRAMQDYKLSSGRMFPTWSEVLEVLLSLGYDKPGLA